MEVFVAVQAKVVDAELAVVGRSEVDAFVRA